MPLPTISDRFNGAIQKTAQERKIAELQAEIAELRAAQSPELEGQVQNLREQLQQSGENHIRIELIDPNPQQPRQTITSSAIRAKANSLEKHGQITPIILIPHNGDSAAQPAKRDRYILLDGQLRWEAAKLLGWEAIRAVTVPMPKDLNRSSLLTFLHFEDLNPLDKVEAVVQEIIKATELEADRILTVLSTVLKRIERDGKTKQLAELVVATEEERQQELELLGLQNRERNLLIVLLDLGLNPGSVKNNLLPMLSLPSDLKTAIRQQGLKGAHALVLAALSAKNLNISEHQASKERIAATRQVLEQNLSVPESRKLVGEIKTRFLKPEESQPTSPLERIHVVTQQLKKKQVWKSPEKLARLDVILTELEALMLEK